jgi:hypothetical protein
MAAHIGVHGIGGINPCAETTEVISAYSILKFHSGLDVFKHSFELVLILDSTLGYPGTQECDGQ